MPLQSPVIAIATYKRAEGLATLLLSLSEATAYSVPRIIVIDNDASGSARAVVDKAALECEYYIEPVPGITAARNAALSRLRASDDAVIFVDDDESVSLSWYRELLQAADETNADVLNGPVIPVYPEACPAWIVRGGFFEREESLDGVVPRFPATNNALVMTRAIARLPEPVFSHDFSATGGSDTDFFARLATSGAVLRWAPAAAVYEHVPMSRASFKWIWRRNVRLGNVSARMKMRDRPRICVCAFGVLRIVWGVLATIADGLLKRGVYRRSFAHIPKGVGMASATLGSLVKEYR